MPLQRNLQRIEASLEKLARVGRSRRADAMRAARAGVELPRAAQVVLRHVVDDGPVRVSDLARALHMSDAVASRTVTALERADLLARSASPDDGRVALVQITARGRRVQRQLRAAQDEIFHELLAHWSASELARLADLMERLARDLRGPAKRSSGATRGRAAHGGR